MDKINKSEELLSSVMEGDFSKVVKMSATEDNIDMVRALLEAGVLVILKL